MNRAAFIKSSLALISGGVFWQSCSQTIYNKLTIAENANIAFFGDSITFQGGYIKLLQEHFSKSLTLSNVTLNNYGKNSETVSGLSEAIHDPSRPVLFDRLENTWSNNSYDLAFFCYGINDGIYHPFSMNRFKAFQDGVTRFIHFAEEKKTSVVILTPPPMRPLSRSDESERSQEYSWKNPYWNYGPEVMDRYRTYIMKIEHPIVRTKIDIYTPLSNKISASYDKDPIHPNAQGHRIIANTIIAQFNT